MKTAALIFCAIALGACTPSQDEHARAQAEQTKEKARETAEKVKEDTRVAAEQAEADAKRAGKRSIAVWTRHAIKCAAPSIRLTSIPIRTTSVNLHLSLVRCQ